VVGLANFPVARHQLAQPKIGLYTGSANIPSYPLNRTQPNDGHCGLSGGAVAAFCQATHALVVKDKIPQDVKAKIAKATADIKSGALKVPIITTPTK
jgi:basic membrane lipoprotein Med (substrate-binding protein (PBP1-ABC) superfamily)